jgi:hypothetical protein
MRTAWRNGVAGLAGVALLGVGVAGGYAIGDSSGGSTRPARPVAADKPNTPVFRGELVSYNSCDSMLTALRARARALVGPYGFSGGYETFRSAGGSYDLKEAVPLAGGTTAALAPEAAASDSTGNYSATNNQVTGVDEPDVVKTNGKVMVSLDGQQLHIVDVQNSKLRATLALPYAGTELLLAGDQVVILSGESSGGGPIALRIPAGYAGSTSTTASVVDISDPSAPRVQRTFSFDAGELAARVVDGTIRLVLSSPPPTALWTTPRDSTKSEIARATKINQGIVDALPLDAWLPHWKVDSGPEKLLTACGDVATPAKTSAAGMVTVLSLDPTKTAPGAGTSVFGAASTAYAEGDHLYISDNGTYAGTNGPWPAYEGDTNPVPTVQTPTVHLLEFDISDPAQARFLASGTVTGQLHDSYALSEYQDALRVTTTTSETISDGPHSETTGVSVTSISILQRQGTTLTQVSHVGGLGAGEQVYAVRYIADRGYVVTYQQIDPLHVVDLSDPHHPALRGTLSLSGYSTLLQPLPNHQLLGIGRAVSATVPCGAVPPGAVTSCGGPIETTDGVQMVLFDVTDAAHPKLLSKQVLTGSYAVDPNSPHTLTADPAKVTDGGSFVMPSTNGLLGIRVAASKITIATAPFSKPYSVQSGRAIFANDHVFELADRGVAVRRIADLKQTGWVAF